MIDNDILNELKAANDQLNEVLSDSRISVDGTAKFERSTRGLALLIRAWCEEQTKAIDDQRPQVGPL